MEVCGDVVKRQVGEARVLTEHEVENDRTLLAQRAYARVCNVLACLEVHTLQTFERADELGHERGKTRRERREKEDRKERERKERTHKERRQKWAKTEKQEYSEGLLEEKNTCGM